MNQQFDTLKAELRRAVAKNPQHVRDRYMLEQVEQGRFALVVACNHCKEPYDPECSDDYDVVCRAHCERPHFDVHRGGDVNGDARDLNPDAASDVPTEPMIARRTASPHCFVEGCTRSLEARGWCSKHYQRWLAHGDPMHTRPKRADRPKPTRAEVLTEMRNAHAELKASVERGES